MVASIMTIINSAIRISGIISKFTSVRSLPAKLLIEKLIINPTFKISHITNIKRMINFTKMGINIDNKSDAFNLIGKLIKNTPNQEIQKLWKEINITKYRLQEVQESFDQKLETLIDKLGLDNTSKKEGYSKLYSNEKL